MNVIFTGIDKEGTIRERVVKELDVKLRASIVPKTKLNFSFFQDQDYGDVLHLPL